MERDTNQMSQSPSLCRSGCGFYGNPSSDGLCSKCYKDAVKRKQSAPSSQLSQSSSSSVSHSSAGRNSPTISTQLTDSSANLPLLTTTFENSLNTASPTIPTAIIASAQEFMTKLESVFEYQFFDSVIVTEMKRNQRNKKNQKNSKKPRISDQNESETPNEDIAHTENQTQDKNSNSNIDQKTDPNQQNLNDSNTDLSVKQNGSATNASQQTSNDSDLQKIDSLEGSENQESSNQSNVSNANIENNSSNSSSPTTPQTDSNPPKTQKKKKNRCTKCKVSVGVIGFPCRCGGTFCSSHRYANEHNCTFDYKEHGAEEIRKNNPQVIGEKVTKI